MAASEDLKLQATETRPFTYGNIDITQIQSDPRKLRIYLDGVFDMTHYGHFRLFERIRAKFPNATIIAGVTSDADTVKYKGHTLMDEHERSETVGHCRFVDEVICPCPWFLTQEFLDKNQIDYVAHDGLPYVSGNMDDVYAFVKKNGRFIATQRTEGVSTTDLINRIVRRYNEFVLRNLKRGASRKELNVSWTRANRIKLQNNIKTINKNVEKWMDNPSTFIDDFTKIFGREGKIVHKVEAKRAKIEQEGGIIPWSLKYCVTGAAVTATVYFVSRGYTARTQAVQK